MIRLRGVSKSVSSPSGPLPILRGVDLDVGEGESVAVVGPSGSGKSTLLNIIGLLDSYSDGSFHLLDRDVGTLDERERDTVRREVIGFVFQAFHLLERRTVASNVRVGLAHSTVPRHEWAARSADALAAVNLGERGASRVTVLSGGEKQRVAIARATAAGRRLLLCDEPTGNLDSSTAAQVMHHLLELVNNGVTLIVATHDDRVAGACDRVIELRDGAVRQAGRVHA